MFLFLVKLWLLIITGGIIGLLATIWTGSPYAGVGAFLLWAVLNKKKVFEGTTNAYD